MKPEPHLVVGDSFADGAGASAAGDFDLARPTEQVFSVPRHADGPAALLAPVPKVALFFLSAPYNADQVFETQVRAECHFFFACCTAGEADILAATGDDFGDLARFRDEATCVEERLEEGSEANLLARGIVQAEQAGRFRYDAALAQKCGEARNNALNNCQADAVIGDEGVIGIADECLGTAGAGLVKDGQPCFFDFECEIPGSQCLPPGALENPEACAVDDDCASDELCVEGFCAFDIGAIEIHDDKICIRPIDETEDCSLDPDFPNLPPFCEVGTRCITAENGDQTCEIPFQEGDDCLATQNCERGLFCDLEGGVPGSCTLLRGEGDDCNSSEECEFGLFCDLGRATPTCEAPLPVDVFICTGIEGAEDPNYPVTE